jgi:hypothetical protein
MRGNTFDHLHNYPFLFIHVIIPLINKHLSSTMHYLFNSTASFARDIEASLSLC